LLCHHWLGKSLEKAIVIVGLLGIVIPDWWDVSSMGVVVRIIAEAVHITHDDLIFKYIRMICYRR
jgi:hypothetical protein